MEEVHEPKKDPHSWQLLVAALNKATNNEDQKDVEGQRNLFNSFVWGDVNVPKTRTMNFVSADHIYPGWTYFRILFHLLLYFYCISNTR